ncbi:MAG: alpha/beta fold hydrolase [Cardiobacteriaceae bacterium]|nr:alpha/beta fold hydrolase [Cardiobacteriaceae bacterium]
MKIFLSHGRGSSQHSKEMHRLARIAKENGHHAYRINDTDTEDPELRAERLIQLVDEAKEDILLVGFSMGGYTSMLAAAAYPDKVKGLFLLAPALYAPRYKVKTYPIIHPTVIIHGWNDDIILYEHSVGYAREARATLHLVDAAHTFLESDELDVISHHFQKFLTYFL